MSRTMVGAVFSHTVREPKQCRLERKPVVIRTYRGTQEPLLRGQEWNQVVAGFISVFL